MIAQSKILKDQKILLVEDTEDNRFLFTLVLEQAGAIVECANHGKAAVERLILETGQLSTEFSLVLMDMQMPVMDGYEATRRLRANGYELPVIALTAHSSIYDRQECLDAGCSDYAAKPIELHQLVKLVEKHLRQQTLAVAE